MNKLKPNGTGGTFQFYVNNCENTLLCLLSVITVKKHKMAQYGTITI